MEKGKVNKNNLKTIVDNQLKNPQLVQNGNAEDIRNIITDAITVAVETVIATKTNEIVEEIKKIVTKEFEEIKKDANTLKERVDQIEDERKVLKKVILEQQKCLEFIRRDKLRNNVFMTGIPNTATIDGAETADNKTIIDNVFSYLLPAIDNAEYRITKAFDPKPGFTRHSALITFNNYDTKTALLGKSKELVTRTDEHSWLRKVFIRSEQTPLASKENSRLYEEFKKLRDQHEGDDTTVVKLEKGKLFVKDKCVDEFNLANQLF